MTRTFRGLLAAAALLAVSVAPAAASPFAFASATDNNLYSIDLATGTPSLIGGFGAIDGLIESLAYSPTGQLYGISSSGSLYSINTITALATLIGSTDLGNIEALDFNGDTLTATNFTATPTAYSIDTATAAAAAIVTAGSSTGAVRAGAIQDANTLLMRGDGGLGCAGNCLFSLNLTTGTVTLIGLITGVPSSIVTGLDFAGGVLYGLNIAGQAFSVDAATAVATPIGAASGIGYLGMATVESVPEPATLALLGAGLAVAAARRRRAS